MNHWWFKLWDESGWGNQVIIVCRERKFAHWASPEANTRKLVRQSGNASTQLDNVTMQFHPALGNVSAEGSPWNVTIHFHPVPMKCHHALPPSAGSVSAAEGSSHQPCVALEQLSHSFFINSTSKRPGISTTSDRSRVWWLSEGEGEPPRRTRTPFWKSHTPLDSWGLGLSRHGWGVQNGVRFRRGAEEGGQRTCPTRLNQNFLPA